MEQAEQQMSAIEVLTHRILEAARSLGDIREVVVVPHAVAGNFICRVALDPGSDRRAYKKLFNGTTVGDCVYFTRTAPGPG
jgi:hypothetical protein